jgi:hypothetical protein
VKITKHSKRPSLLIMMLSPQSNGGWCLRLASLLWRLLRATAMETGLFELQAKHLRESRQSSTGVSRSCLCVVWADETARPPARLFVRVSILGRGRDSAGVQSHQGAANLLMTPSDFFGTRALRTSLHKTNLT